MEARMEAEWKLASLDLPTEGQNAALLASLDFLGASLDLLWTALGPLRAKAPWSPLRVPHPGAHLRPLLGLQTVTFSTKNTKNRGPETE